eukprot:scaffold46295_cov62-Phaeocystis_antarctica.AAC.2
MKKLPSDELDYIELNDPDIYEVFVRRGGIRSPASSRAQPAPPRPPPATPRAPARRARRSRPRARRAAPRRARLKA